MKRKVWLLLISTLIFTFSLPAKEKVKIGVVDLQRILMESTAGKKAKKELNDFYEQKKKELAKKEEELNKLKDDIDKKLPLLDEKTKREKQMEFENKRLEFLQDAQESEKLLKEKDAELTQSIIKDVQEIVDDIADSEGYTFIFEKNEGGLLYFDKLTDITDQVLKKYEAKTRK